MLCEAVNPCESSNSVRRIPDALGILKHRALIVGLNNKCAPGPEGEVGALEQWKPAAWPLDQQCTVQINPTFTGCPESGSF